MTSACKPADLKCLNPECFNQHSFDYNSVSCASIRSSYNLGLNGYGATALAVILVNIIVLIVLVVFLSEKTVRRAHPNMLLGTIILGAVTVFAALLLAHKNQIPAFVLALPEAITYVVLVIALVVAAFSRNPFLFMRF